LKKPAPRDHRAGSGSCAATWAPAVHSREQWFVKTKSVQGRWSMSFEGGRGDNLSGAQERDCLIYSSFMHAQDTACATCCFRPGALLQTRGAACCTENSCAAQHTYNHVMFWTLFVTESFLCVWSARQFMGVKQRHVCRYFSQNFRNNANIVMSR
jgi:hypothetical protein